jgi:carbon-monoxide dehydrogenase medium subunit
VKPAPFAYHAPAAVKEALDLLARYGGDARPLAGGQSLMPMLNLRLARPSALVDLNRIAELAYHRVDQEALVAGALCRQRDVELDGKAMSRCAAIADAVPLVGHVAIRNRGTVVGSVVHADPAAEWPALALLLDATISIRGTGGSRSVPAAEFFTGVFSTALQPGEVAVEVRFGWPPPGAGTAFVEVARRHGDFALVAAAALLEVSPDRVVKNARLVLAGVDATPVRARAAEEALIGEKAGEKAFSAAAEASADGLHPADDVHAPAAYRRKLAGTLTERVLVKALERVGGNGR